VQAALSRIRQATSGIGELPDATSAQSLLPNWRQTLNDLMDVEKHYQRKERLLFSCLERHGIAGPSNVMWETVPKRGPGGFRCPLDMLGGYE